MHPALFLVRTALATGCFFLSNFAFAQDSQFALHTGDRVVFYGDSITEQQLYTRDLELYTLTHYPQSDITFVMAGVSGDKVSGGGGGPIDQRLPRDLFAYNPTVITIMLGMNDGYYKPYDAGTMRTYELGYAHILDEIKAHAPDARVLVLRPSAYDEITQPGHGVAGYNEFLIRMGDSIKRMAAERHMQVANLNAPMIDTLTRAAAADPALAQLLIADHVHPGPAMHWIMADAILKAWNAPGTVSAATLDAAGGTITASTNTELSQLKRTGNSLTWQQKDAALPLPLQPAAGDLMLALALRSSSAVQDLDQEMLMVTHLIAARYQLRIDDQPVTAFTREQLGSGVNLAMFDTPMLRQSEQVYLTDDSKISLDTARNHLLRNVPSPANDTTLAAVNAALHAVEVEQHRQAQPVLHRFELRALP